MQKDRDRLLSAALRLAESPTKTQEFLEEADAVIDALKEAPRIAVVHETHRHTKESRLNVAIEILRTLQVEYEGYQGRLSAALEQLEQIPR